MLVLYAFGQAIDPSRLRQSGGRIGVVVITGFRSNRIVVHLRVVVEVYVRVRLDQGLMNPWVNVG